MKNIEQIDVKSEIKLLEEEKKGLVFMIGTTEDWVMKTDYMNQVLDIDEKINFLKSKTKL